MKMNLREVASFHFVSSTLDVESGNVELKYSLDDRLEFTEKISLGRPLSLPSADNAAAALRAVHALHLAAGVSYYKTCVPKNLVVESTGLDNAEAEFFGRLYSRGLAEFAHRNNLSIADRLAFPVSSAVSSNKSGSPVLPERALVPIGGGKDSLAAVEVLRSAGVPTVLFGVNRSWPVLRCIERSGLPAILAERHLDPRLAHLNADGAYNGHVPVTAIISLMAIAAATLHGANAVVMANERSANEGNLVAGGLEINHQYSKSFEFEVALARLVKTHIASTLAYFSLLRPLSEIHITRLFSSETRYDEVFSSCNRNFHQDAARNDRIWCLKCAKCRFMTLALALSMPKSRVLAILGGNMLANDDEIDGFREIVGARGHKPWECVGELNESAAAMWHLSGDDSWRQDAVVHALALELAPRKDELEAYYRRLFVPLANHRVPRAFERALNVALARL